MALASKITQYDRKEYEKESRRGGGGNIYRLGLLLEAKEKVEHEVAAHLKDDSPEAMDALKKAIGKNFEANFPPAKNILGQIDKWLTKKKKPSLV